MDLTAARLRPGPWPELQRFLLRASEIFRAPIERLLVAASFGRQEGWDFASDLLAAHCSQEPEPTPLAALALASPCSSDAHQRYPGHRYPSSYGAPNVAYLSGKGCSAAQQLGLATGTGRS